MDDRTLELTANRAAAFATPRPSPRGGMTLIELLVVISIIGVLVGLLLPGVQAAREAARRMSCKNNLKQIGVAMHNYESAYRALPSGYLHKYGEPGSADEWANHMGLAWGGALLGQLEQPGLFEQIEMERPIWSDSNRESRETFLPVFLCPSDTYSPDKFVIRDDSSSPEEKYATASYAANWGPANDAINLDATPDDSDGVFFRNSRLKFRAILDGLTSTLAVGERHNGPISAGATAGGHAEFENSWIAAVREITDHTDDHGHMVLFETQFTPNEAGGDDKGLAAPHVGVCQFLMCDGSIQPITMQVDRVVYDALATRHGREIVDVSSDAL